MRTLFNKYFGIFKYVASGGTAACVNLATLYTLTEYAGIYYLQSAVLAFTAAFLVSFLLQKFWTFGDSRKDIMHWQMAGFLGTALLNLILNTSIIFVLVEFFHVWYLLAALIAGGLLAFATFFLYRNLIFFKHEEGSRMHAILFALKHRAAIIMLCGVFVLVTFLAFYQLTESPPTWLDEGIITQTAINITTQGFTTALQVAPNTFVSAGYVSTAYPVTYPIAITFWAFGIGILQARVVMALFIIALVAASYVFLKREVGVPLALSGSLLLATFAPLYGNGKNVLGEIPGLLFLVLFLLFVKKIESKNASVVTYAGAGVLLGLAVATKPIFLLLLPAVGIVFLFSLKLFSLKKAGVAIIGFLAPIALWLLVHFRGETISQMFSIYANPHSNDIGSSLLTNILGFVTHVQPLYALLLLGVWALSLAVRIVQKQHISRAEYIAAGFALLVYMAYLRGAEYYRYFFLGEVLALLYLPFALSVLAPKRIPRQVLFVCVGLLALLQLYQCFFDSWVAEHYASRRSQDIAALTSGLSDKVVFIYQAPEVVTFLPPSTQYYQYLEVTKTIVIGKEYTPLISQKSPYAILTSAEKAGSIDLQGYMLSKTADRYELWLRK